MLRAVGAMRFGSDGDSDGGGGSSGGGGGGGSTEIEGIDDDEDLSVRPLSVEEKLMLGELIASGKSTIRVLARQHNLPTSTVHYWSQAASKKRTLKPRGYRHARPGNGADAAPAAPAHDDPDPDHDHYPIAASLLGRRRRFEEEAEEEKEEEEKEKKKKKGRAPKPPPLTLEQKQWLADQQVEGLVSSTTLAERFGLKPRAVRYYAGKARAGEPVHVKSAGRPRGAKNKKPGKTRAKSGRAAAPAAEAGVGAGAGAVAESGQAKHAHDDDDDDD